MELTKDQKNALETIKKFLEEKDKHYMTLGGFAGTGKTTLVNFIVQYCNEQDISVAVTATTNKAVKVLRDKVDIIYKDDMMTIHKMLNVKAQKYGTREIFKADLYGDMDMNRYNLIIVDEASMVSSIDKGKDKALLSLIKEQRWGDTKILFVGDPAQLQPINETVSKVFEFDPVMLNKIVRYDDGIANVAKVVRERDTIVDIDEIVNGVEVTKATMADVAPLFTDWRSNPDNARMLTWTNNSVFSWNKRLRRMDYGEEKERFVPGDIVIANTPTMDGKAVLMNNSEEGVVTKVFRKTGYWLLDIEKEDGNTVYGKVLDRDKQPKLEAKLQQLADNREWKRFWELKKEYHDLRHAYAMTVHKSQGSTFNNVVVDFTNINSNNDILNRNQLLYVAITRAAKSVKIIEQ